MTILGRGIACAAVLAATLCGTTAVSAQQRTPAETIAARSEAMKTYGAEMKAIGDAAKAGTITKDDAVTRAKKLNDLANQMNSWFPAGTGPESGAKTRALPAIWEKQAEFKADIDKFALETARLVAAAETGQASAIAAQHGEVGKACGTCHTSFRARQ